MEKRICSELDCNRPIKARGLCQRHYLRARSQGTLEPLPRRAPVTNVDLEHKTCDCPVHGANVALRIRPRKERTYLACRRCDQQHYSRKRRPTGYVPTWTKYGLTEEAFQILFTAQGGRCMICRDEMSAPMVDHSHQSGEVRALLCRRCNWGLGCFRDNPAAMTRAIGYLKRYG